MKLLRFNESIEQDNIKDYFIDFIDDDFSFSIGDKKYCDEQFNYKPYPFNGCAYIEHSIDILLKKSKEYKSYEEDFINSINRCCESEGFEIKNYSFEHFFGGSHNYHFKCTLKEPFDEKVDEPPIQFINDFIDSLKRSLSGKLHNASFTRDDIIIQSKGDQVIIKTIEASDFSPRSLIGRINTQNKFRTLSNLIKEFGNARRIYSTRITTGNSYYKFDVTVQVPSFENDTMVREGIITLSNITIADK